MNEKVVISNSDFELHFFFECDKLKRSSPYKTNSDQTQMAFLARKSVLLIKQTQT